MLSSWWHYVEYDAIPHLEEISPLKKVADIIRLGWSLSRVWSLILSYDIDIWSISSVFKSQISQSTKLHTYHDFQKFIIQIHDGGKISKIWIKLLIKKDMCFEEKHNTIIKYIQTGGMIDSVILMLLLDDINWNTEYLSRVFNIYKKHGIDDKWPRGDIFLTKYYFILWDTLKTRQSMNKIKQERIGKRKTYTQIQMQAIFILLQEESTRDRILEQFVERVINPDEKEKNKHEIKRAMATLKENKIVKETIWSNVWHNSSYLELKYKWVNFNS